MKKRIRPGEEGSAIIFVIVFITIVMFFISLVLLFNHLQYISILRYGINIQTYYNAKSAVLLTLDQQNLVHSGLDFNYDNFTYHLFDSDCTVVYTEPFGLYARYTAISKIKSSRSKRTFLIGRESDERFTKSLVIGDIRNPVIVTGNAAIRGDVLVGPQGIKPGVIRGIGFKGDRSVYGSIEKDTKSHLPLLDVQSVFVQRNRLKNISGLDFEKFQIEKNKLYLNDLNLSLNQDAIETLKDNGIYNLIGPGKIICYDNIELNDINILNQVTVFSDSTISFTGSSTSKDILVFANKIFLDGPVIMSGQFFAQTALNIDNSACMDFPAVAALISDTPWPDNTQLNIGRNARINGFVFISNTAEVNQVAKYMININTSAAVNGYTYSDMYTEFRGNVNGGIMTNAFYLYEKPTIYINWIKDAMINRTLLEKRLKLPLAYDIGTDYIIAREL